MWPALTSAGSYQDFIRQERQRVEFSAPERSLLCRHFILPPYVAVKLSTKDRREKIKTGYSSELTCDLSRPLRLIYETGAEVRIASTRAGLQIEVIYHLHPWVSPSAPAEKSLFKGDIGWTTVLDPKASRHAHLSWIARLPEQIADKAGWQVVDMAGNEFLQIVCPLFRISVSREKQRGLRISGYADPKALDLTRPSVTLPLGDMAQVIEQEAGLLNQRLKALGLPAKLGLEVATFYFGVGLLAKDHLLKLAAETIKILRQSGKAPFSPKG